ncbi:hypothetical protein [Telluribacter sp. SYSU D00476]|uniref:hypothetical protein n=1 Tax=Telluribacter sp. SYSU D00476 TaxID=2811430 RepID=UPI001FF13A3B|nr:hypothetical protein [Telluribacter sp. SYSU D00476]
MKIIFVSNNWADAHQQVRLQALLALCPSLVCLTFTRTYYPATSSIEPLWTGRMEHASYLKRWNIYIQFFRQLYKTVKNGDIVYTYGFDLAAITLLFRTLTRRSVYLVHEVPDIREMFFRKGKAGWLLRRIERWVIPRIDLLVVTSPEYVTEYYQKLRGLPVRKYLVIENKIHTRPHHLPNTPERPASQNRIRIGYFGLLRCKASLDCLMLLACTNRFDIILRGIFMPDTRHYESLVKETPNMQYLGPYDAPKELKTLYGSVDIVWAAYPYSPRSITGNHLWARTNRFYESLYFRRPIVVQKGTSDADRARTLGNIAIEVDLEDTRQAAQYLEEQLTPDYLQDMEKALTAIPEHEYLIKDEYKTLVRCLQLRK